MVNLEKIKNFDNEIFYSYCKEKKLVFQKCKNCGNVIWPFSVVCPECYMKDIELIESKGFGKIYTFTIFNVPFHKSFKNKTPYVVAIIHLNEGAKMVSNIVNSDFNKIKCNASVKVFWDKAGDFYIPKFTLI